MSEESVRQAEVELGQTPQDLEILKGVRLTWQKLTKLRQQAVRDEKFVTQYRDFLSRCLQQAKAQQSSDDDEVIQREARAFWAWYDGECARLNVREMEQNRGAAHQAWCMKWLAGKYADFAAAVTKTFDEPTPQHYEAAKAKASAMLKSYTEFFKSG